MNTGYSSPDWGMEKFYMNEDKAQNWESVLEGMKEDCYKIALHNFKTFAFENGEDYYFKYGLEPEEQEAWRDWLLDECDNDVLQAAMERAINYNEDFTTIDWVIEAMERTV